MRSCTAGFLELSACQFQGGHLVFLSAVLAGGIEGASVDEDVITSIIVVVSSKHQLTISVAHI